MNMKNKINLKFIPVILCFFAVNAICSISFLAIPGTVFSQVKVESGSKQTIKTAGAQESTLKSVSSQFGFATGLIFDNVTGDGISDVTVTLEQSDSVVESANTAADGTFFFQALPGGYNITAVKKGFFNSNEDVKVLAFVTTVKNINMAPTISLPPTPPPTGEPPSSECRQGGSPIDIIVSPESLKIKSGRTKRVRVRVLKEERGGCSIDVIVNCSGDCDKIELSDEVVTTNSLGFAVIAIKAKRNEDGIAAVTFTAGNVQFQVPVTMY